MNSLCRMFFVAALALLGASSQTGAVLGAALGGAGVAETPVQRRDVAASVRRRGVQELINRRKAAAEDGLNYVLERRFVRRLWVQERMLRKDCREGVPDAQLTRPMMRPDELEVMVTLMSSVSYYLEYGSGSSTEFFGQMANFTVSIESSYTWCRDVYDRPVMKCLINQGRVDLICLGLSETGVYAAPTTWASENHLTNYHLYIRAISYINFPRYDLVLIDGRFRLCIALYILRHISNNTIVAIHDFNFRPQYHKVLNYYDVVQSAYSLVVLKKKSTLQAEDLLEWQKHIRDTR